MRALLKIVTSPSPALDDGAAGPPPLTYRRYALAIAVIADYASSGNYLDALERVAPSPLRAAGA